MMRIKLLLSTFLVMVVSGSVMAAGSHGRHGGGHDGAAHAVGVLNAVEPENSKVNITHGPIPALKWPEMAMDLPVTDSVDLNAFKTGQKVQFAILLGADKKFRITAMCPTDKDEVVAGLCDRDQAGHGGHDH